MTTARALLHTAVLALLLAHVAVPAPVHTVAASSTYAGSAQAHDAFHASLRVRPHGRCVLRKSDAQVRARLLCRDGLRTTIRPCPYEDSERCFWNASTSGDGQGRSFLRFKHRTHYYRG